jgi:hypothetical protein
MLRQSRVLGSHLGQGHSFTYGRAKEGQSQQIRRYYLLGLAVQSRGSQGLVGNYSRLLRGQRQMLRNVLAPQGPQDERGSSVL